MARASKCLLLVALALAVAAAHAAAGIDAAADIDETITMRTLSAVKAVKSVKGTKGYRQLPGGVPNLLDPRQNPGMLRVKSYDSRDAPTLAALAADDSLTRISPASSSAAAPVPVPPSFFGLSLDLNEVEGVAADDYIELVKGLAAHDNGPMIMRVGAYQADRMVTPWNVSVYFALNKLHRATGTKFIVGVNQHAEDVAVTQAQVRRNEQLLPKGSVLSYSVGNEPDMYSLQAANGLPGSDLPKPANWLGLNWVGVSRRIYKAAFDAAWGKKILSGPDWSDSHLTTGTLLWWLRSTRTFLNQITVHYYGGDILKDTKIAQLLDDERITKKVANVRELVRTGKEQGGLPLRITEVATISYGGIQGLSDTAGAAIWALDVGLELAYAGASGINYHQVLSRHGNANYNAISYDAVAGTIHARLPYYGYLMLQQSLAGGADILGRSISPSGCKAWLLRGRKDGSLRAVVINKNGDGKECAADIVLSEDEIAKHADCAEAEYMYAPGGIDERWRLFYSNWYFGEVGSKKLRDRMAAPVFRYKSAAGQGGGFTAHLTKGTVAALVTIPLAAAPAAPAL
ncbi:MAG: hypothetical protein J3K34DRAFT_438150 [Monoraphidium minutum]|nr:MAG: hypothetical protein J3K34DRAFT_438150 [Monoraphidium minutum]